MGMTINEIIEELESTKDYPANDPASDEAIDGAISIMRKYQKIQADYETRLKADMVAMLTDTQLEIDELDSKAGYDGNGMPTFSTDYIRKKKINELIQQKIDSLKGVIEE